MGVVVKFFRPFLKFCISFCVFFLFPTWLMKNCHTFLEFYALSGPKGYWFSSVFNHTKMYHFLTKKIVKMSCSNSTKKYLFVIFQRKHKSVHIEFSRQIDEGFDWKMILSWVCLEDRLKCVMCLWNGGSGGIGGLLFVYFFQTFRFSSQLFNDFF